MALRHQWRLEKVASRNGAENADCNTAEDQRTEDRLDEDGILDLAESRLLNPDLAVEDLADDVALLILGDPRLILPRIAGGVRAECIVGVKLGIVPLRLVV